MKDYSSLTTRIMIQLEPELAQEFQQMLNDIVVKLSELEEIKNAKPSKFLEWLGENWIEYGIQDTVIQIKDTNEFNAIKQALIQAEEDRKKIEELEERERFNAIGKSSQYCKNEVVK